MNINNVLFFSLLFASINSFGAGETLSTENTFNLRVMTYNVHGLPVIGSSEEQFQEMGRVLAQKRKNGTAPHVVVIQEGFDKDVNLFLEGSGYPYIQKGPRAKDRVPGTPSGGLFSKILNSGLYILSEYPIESIHMTPFLIDSCAQSDCRANKGLLYVKINFPGVPTPVQIITTHMNANGSRISKENAERVKSDNAKLAQINETGAFLSKNLDRHLPVIFAGDFNIKKTRAHWDIFQKTLSMTNAAQLCLSREPKCIIATGADRIALFENTPDHQYFDSGDQVSVEPYEVMKTMTETLDNKPLSDHLGLQVNYKLSWQ